MTDLYGRPLVIEDHGGYVVTADLAPEPMTEDDIRAMYPDLTDKGVANYLRLANRVLDKKFRYDVLISRRRLGECLTQPRIREGMPWIDDCLTHDVVASMAHHFAVHPEASTD